MKKILRGGKGPALAQALAPQSLVDLALETWRFRLTAESCLPAMDPMDAERFANGFAWYQRKVHEVLAEAGLSAVDLTGRLYDPGMAATPLNLDDFPQDTGFPLRVSQTVEPVIMERGSVRKAGAVMLEEVMD